MWVCGAWQARLRSWCSSHRCVWGQALAGELKKVCGGTSVAVRNGRIEVKGHHRGVIKEYLQGMGF